MSKLSIYHRPIMTHLSDDDLRTLCGLDLGARDWECTGTIWPDEEEALCGCARCQAIADKRAAATNEAAR